MFIGIHPHGMWHVEDRVWSGLVIRPDGSTVRLLLIKGYRRVAFSICGGGA